MVKTSAERGFDPWVLVTVLLAVPLVIAFAASILYGTAYSGRIYLGVSAGGVDLAGYTPAQARGILVSGFEQYSRTPLTLRYGQREWKATPAEMGMRFDVEDTVSSAYAVGRDGSFGDQVRARIEAWRDGESARRPVFRLDPAQRDSFFSQLAKQINRQPVDAKLTLAASQFQARVSTSQSGLKLNVEETAQRIEEAIAVQSTAPIEVIVETVPAATIEADLQTTKVLAEKMMSSPLVAQFEEQTWKIERDDIADLLSLREQQSGSPKFVVEVADQPLQRLATRIGKAINRPALNARFDYAGGSLKVIREGVSGRTLDVSGTIAAIKAQLGSDNRTVALPVKVTKPAIGSTDGSKLAIAGVIEEATTSYAGSIPERAYNVELAASRLHGIVVAPGQQFSFNDEVGQVNTLAGYKVGFGITQEGGSAITVPSVGGGICQVATTLFHPVFWAGYEIGQRTPHLYWIPGYGLPPKGLKGLDTTVDQIYDKEGNLSYAVDFTFINNSPHPILIQSKADGKTLSFKLLGTKPGWEVKVDGPVISNVVPKINETVKQDDPTMPVGRTIFIEEAREGFKSVIVRTVTQDGKQVDRHTFTSQYQPTRNVYLVGTKKDPAAPAAPAPNPSVAPTATPNPTPARR